jgi:glycosyltransferase involved in cell wall biosynthesis
MSDDGTREIVERYCRREPRLRVIANPGRIVSTGLNAAIHAAKGEIVIRMDAHTRYAADYCRQCIEALTRTGADNVGGPARTEARGLRARAIAAAFHSPFSTGGARFHDQNYEGWADTAPYGCWRKRTLLRLGLFDESLARNQDDELNLRLLRGGGRIWLTPAIRSWYSPRPRLRPLWRQYFQYGFWKVAVIRKHRTPASWRHLVPCVFVLAQISLLFAIVAASAAGRRDWLQPVAVLWLAIASAYLGLVLAASVLAARRHGLDLLPLLPAVFAVFHFAYGLGFCAGLARPLVARGSPMDAGSVFARLTR